MYVNGHAAGIGKGVEGIFDVALELGDDAGFAGGDLESDVDILAGIDDDVFEETEADDVTTVAGIMNALEGVVDLLFSE